MVATDSRMRAWTLALLSISFCATRYGTASATNAALTEEKIQLSKIGKLHYADLSDDEKLDLFQEYKTECQRVVRDYDDLLECCVQGLDNLTIILIDDARHHVLHSDSTRQQMKRKKNTVHSRNPWWQ